MNEKIYTQEMIDKIYERGQITTSWLVWKFRCTFEHATKILLNISFDYPKLKLSISGHVLKMGK